MELVELAKFVWQVGIDYSWWSGEEGWAEATYSIQEHASTMQRTLHGSMVTHL